jgi:hypothetical protein
METYLGFPYLALTHFPRFTVASSCYIIIIEDFLSISIRTPYPPISPYRPGRPLGHSEWVGGLGGWAIVKNWR